MLTHLAVEASGAGGDGLSADAISLLMAQEWPEMLGSWKRASSAPFC